MSYYFIAQIKIHNQKDYQEYTDKVSATVTKYKGQYLVVDANSTIIEGPLDNSRCVIITFPTKNDFENWYHSREYQDILPIRLSSADNKSILVKGLNEIK